MVHRKNQTHANISPCNRRDFLALAATAATAASLGGWSADSSAATVIRRTDSLSLDLGGNTWTVQQKGKSVVLPAMVPGCQYEDLLNSGKIPDPYYREQNSAVQWVARETWIYHRTFRLGEDMLKKEHVELICHGLDTLATVWINDRHLADTDNMFRIWTLDAKHLLRAGNNSIRIEFHPLANYARRRAAAYKQKYNVELRDQRSWVRKGPYMWGWDWCRAVLTAGIWKNIEIMAFDARITDVGVLQTHQPSGAVSLNVQTTVAGGQQGGLTAHARVLLLDQEITSGSARVVGKACSLALNIDQPKLWWPNGMGGQPLYVVKVELHNAHGDVVDTMTRRIGLRKVEVLPPRKGVAMHVQVNGVPFFAKGADWIPADNIPTRVNPAILRWYMQTAKDCNFNFMRLWGGGYYEEDALFDACDELGIMLQFEFKFANDTYPVRDKAFVANLRAELQDNIRRVRNHPSIAIWSGNNEIGYFKGYNYLFGKVIGGQVRELVPGAFYEVGSGASGSGDIHEWSVWHGQKPFSAYRSVQGFVTEFGMQSFPEPKTVRAYTDKSDRASVHTPVMRYHERDGSGHGNGIIMEYVHEYFGPQTFAFDAALWLSQITQAYGVGSGVEFWRRSMPRSMAATIWQFNDCWPGPTWAMVDWYRRWKAVQYASRRFFAPILVSPVALDKTLELHVVSDRMEDCRGTLSWLVTDMRGARLLSGSHDIDIPARTSRLPMSVDLSDQVKTHGHRGILAWARVRVGSRVVSENIAMFVRPQYLKLPRAVITTDIIRSKDGYNVALHTNTPALYSFLDLADTDAIYSDNYVHLLPNWPRIIHVQPLRAMAPADFSHALKVRSLTDLAPLNNAYPVCNQRTDGVVELGPFDARLHGKQLAASNNHGMPNIGWWNNPKEFIAWQIRIDKAATFNIIGRFATPQGSASLHVGIAGHQVTRLIPQTASWRTPEDISFGNVSLQPGAYMLELHTGEKVRWHPVNVLGLTLQPQS